MMLVTDPAIVCGIDDCANPLPRGELAFEVFEGADSTGIPIVMLVCDPCYRRRTGGMGEM